MGKRCALVWVVLIILCFSSTAFAGEGIKELKLEASNIGRGELPDGESIELVFNKNVVNIVVKENNEKCFKLISDDKDVPIRVIMADDQIDREKRRYVNIEATGGFKSGKNYTLIIDKSFSAKSGVSFKENIELSFVAENSKEGMVYIGAFVIIIIGIAGYFIAKGRLYGKANR